MAFPGSITEDLLSTKRSAAELSKSLAEDESNLAPHRATIGFNQRPLASGISIHLLPAHVAAGSFIREPPTDC